MYAIPLEEKKNYIYKNENKRIQPKNRSRKKN